MTTQHEKDLEIFGNSPLLSIRENLVNTVKNLEFSKWNISSVKKYTLQEIDFIDKLFEIIMSKLSVDSEEILFPIENQPKEANKIREDISFYKLGILDFFMKELPLDIIGKYIIELKNDGIYVNKVKFSEDFSKKYRNIIISKIDKQVTLINNVSSTVTELGLGTHALSKKEEFIGLQKSNTKNTKKITVLYELIRGILLESNQDGIEAMVDTILDGLD